MVREGIANRKAAIKVPAKGYISDSLCPETVLIPAAGLSSLAFELDEENGEKIIAIEIDVT